MFLAIRRDGSILAKGDILYNGRNDAWTFQSVTHPRKVFVTDKADPNGPDSWPNLSSREFYADVLNVGIWDTEYKEWTFTPSWPKTLIQAAERDLHNSDKAEKPQKDAAMDNNDNRDYAEEKYNRAQMEREGREELEADKRDKRNKTVLKARTAIIAENMHMLRDDLHIMTIQEVEDTISSAERTLARLRKSFNSGELRNLLKSE